MDFLGFATGAACYVLMVGCMVLSMQIRDGRIELEVND